MLKNLVSINVDAGNQNYFSVDGMLFDYHYLTGEEKRLLYCPRGKTGSVTIPSGVKYIWSDAFAGCTGITSINIPDSMWFIANDAFAGCKGLTSVNIPSSVTYIDDYAFSIDESYTRHAPLDTINGLAGSYAETFAKKNGYNFNAVTDTVAVKTGDGVIKLSDAITVLSHIVGNRTLTGNAFKNADLDNDEKVSLNDATLMLKLIVNS